MDKETIITTLKQLKPKYEKDGVIIMGLFGSYAKGTQTPFSDIDLAYKINYDQFSTKYKDGFSKLLRLEEIKKELQKVFSKKIDFVPDNNKDILESVEYV